MTFLIDGYNVLPADAELRRVIRRSRSDARAGLVERLDAWATRDGVEVVCVFDGGPAGEVDTKGPIDVLFSGPDAIADDVIVAYADACGDLVTVFTSDRALRRRVEALGARVAGARALFERMGAGRMANNDEN
ncbi:MAG: NYN domain-containing protein [Myxococcales bacterium]|nr:NYN domain-containing protein [Myxococcales bacterium]